MTHITIDKIKQKKEHKKIANFTFLIMQYKDYFDRVQLYPERTIDTCFYGDGNCSPKKHTDTCKKLTKAGQWFKELPTDIQFALLKIACYF